MAAWKCKQKLKKPFHFSLSSLKVGWGRLIQKILIRKNEFANHRNPNSYMVRFYYSISVLYLYPLSVCVTVNLTDTESAYLHFFICIQKSRRGPTQCIFNFLSEKKVCCEKKWEEGGSPPPPHALACFGDIYVILGIVVFMYIPLIPCYRQDKTSVCFSIYKHESQI